MSLHSDKTINMVNKKIISKPLLLIAVGIIIGVIVGFILFKGITEEKAKTTVLENFILEETKDEIKFFDRHGNEILIIDKR